MTTIQAKIRAIDRANVQAAEHILREAAKPGQTTGLSIDWARRVLGKAAA